MPVPPSSGQQRIGPTVAESTPWWPDPVMPPPGSPNVVVVVFDDVGFSDFGCFGSEIDTPTIDALAASGLRYTNFHTTALCSPTRAALLTGRNHHSVGMACVSNWDTGYPGARARIAHSAGTLAEILRDAGYTTSAVGKWHLAPTDETTAAGPHDQWPCQRGFTRFYGFLDGATDHWAPDLVIDNRHVEPPRHDGYHLTEDLIDHAIADIRDQVSIQPERPFFTYLAFGAGHYPLQAPPEHIEKYRGRYDAGWDELRSQRWRRQLEMGVVPEGTELAPRNPEVAPWESLSADEQRVAARMQECYAGMLDHTDAQLGRLVAFLDDAGVLDDTLIVLMSDNGATGEGVDTGYVNYLRQTNGVPPEPIEERLARLDTFGGPDTSVMYPAGWGMAGNTPLKWFKGHTHSGGIRDPLVVSWPARVPTGERGAVRDQYHHVTDIAPTILELVGVEAPDQLAGVAQQPIEGTSLAYTLTDGGASTKKHTQYYEMFGRRGIWHDGWKAVTHHEFGTGGFEHDTWELYHLDADFSECHDLADAEPDRLRALIDLWWSEAGRYQVLPLDDRSLERFHALKPKPIRDRSRFVYWPGVYIPADGCPDIRNVSWRVTAEVASSTDGALIVMGDRHGGWALFLAEGRLVLDYNLAGDHYVVEGALPDDWTPDQPLGFSFERTGTLVGTGRVLAGDTVLGEGPVTGHAVQINAAGISVGWARVASPSPRFSAPYRHPDVRRVVIELGDDRELLGQPLVVID